MSKNYSLHMLLIALVIGLTIQFTLSPSKKFLLDKYGRHTIFHGVNVVYKLPPYIPITDHFDPMNSLSSEDIVYMKQLGFNLVRLGVIWESVERQAGIYDLDYLARIKEIVNQLGENGIFTILDAHQDVFARNFCGEGVPPFYVEDIGYSKTCDSSFTARILGLVKVCKPLSIYNFRYDEQGLPLVEDCKKTNFLEYHFTPEMTSAYMSFYQNKNGIQDKFAAFWQVIAKEFKGNEYVIGYDIWNEPFPGGLWDNLQYIIPGLSDREQLLPVYTKVDKAIREINPNYILFFENMPFPDFLPLFGGLIWGKFHKKPADDIYPQVYNVHNYCCLSGPTACTGSEPSLETTIKTCPKYHRKKINKNIKDAEELQVPLMITEFGACTDSEACYNEIVGVVKAAEENFVSWAYWMYKPFGDHTTSAIAMVEFEGVFNKDGTVQTVKEKSLSRGYVQYYQGVPQTFMFNDECTNFETSFEYDSTIKMPTRLYFNRKFNYPNGYDIEIIRDDTKEQVNATFTEVDSNYIDIKNISEEYHNTILRIIFTAKKL